MEADGGILMELDRNRSSKMDEEAAVRSLGWVYKMG